MLCYDSGDIYEGTLMNGRRNGKGKMTFANGDKYVGNWKMDQMCDSDGQYVYKSGNTYKGSFRTCSRLISGGKYGCFDGMGQYHIVDKGTFSGYFKENKVYGQGKFETIDGKVIELGQAKQLENLTISDFEILIGNLGV